MRGQNATEPDMLQCYDDGDEKREARLSHAVLVDLHGEMLEDKGGEDKHQRGPEDEEVAMGSQWLKPHRLQEPLLKQDEAPPVMSGTKGTPQRESWGAPAARGCSI